MNPEQAQTLRRLAAAYDEVVENAGEVVTVTVTGGSRSHQVQLFAGIDFLAGGFPVEPVGEGRYLVRTWEEEDRIQKAKDAVTSEMWWLRRRAGRAAARAMACPECGAAPNTRCMTSGGKPRQDHQSRSAAQAREMEAVKQECAAVLDLDADELWRWHL